MLKRLLQFYDSLLKLSYIPIQIILLIVMNKKNFMLRHIGLSPKVYFHQNNLMEEYNVSVIHDMHILKHGLQKKQDGSLYFFVIGRINL
jgi:hypothetical protein